MNIVKSIIIPCTFMLLSPLYSETQSMDSSQRALELYEGKQYKESLPYFEYGWSHEKNDSRFYVKYAIALIDSREFQKALSVLQTGLKKYPNEKDANYNLGLTYYWLRDRKKALAGFEKETRINPQNARAYYMAGVVRNEMGDFNQATQMMRMAVLLEPQTELYSKGYNSILTLRAEKILKKSPKEAYELLRKADGIYEKNIKTYELLSYVSFLLENFDESVKASERLIQLEPRIAMYHNNLANALIYQGKDYQRAKREAEKAIELNPGMRLFFLDTLAWAEFQLGEYAKAKENLEESESNMKKQGMPAEMRCSIYYHLGEIWLKEKDINKARSYFQKAVDLKSDSLEAKLASDSLKKLGSK